MIDLSDSPAFLLHKLVFAMDKKANQLLMTNLNISYKRAYFLFTIQKLHSVSQHELAVKLSYSDASVSEMVTALVKAGYIEVKPDPQHGKRQLVSLTPKGAQSVAEGVALLNKHFEEIMVQASIDIARYSKETKQLYEALNEN